MNIQVPELFHDLTGRTFSRLTAVAPGRLMSNLNGGRAWLCQCQCGGLAAVASSHLIGGSVRYCGLCMPKSNTVWVAITGKPDMIMSRKAAITLMGEPQWLLCLSEPELDAGFAEVRTKAPTPGPWVITHRHLPFSRSSLVAAKSAAARRLATKS